MRYSQDYNITTTITKAEVKGIWNDYYDAQGNKYSSRYINCVPMGQVVELRVKDDYKSNETRIMEVVA